MGSPSVRSPRAEVADHTSSAPTASRAAADRVSTQSRRAALTRVVVPDSDWRCGRWVRGRTATTLIYCFPFAGLAIGGRISPSFANTGRPSGGFAPGRAALSVFTFMPLTP